MTDVKTFKPNKAVEFVSLCKKPKWISTEHVIYSSEWALFSNELTPWIRTPCKVWFLNLRPWHSFQEIMQAKGALEMSPENVFYVISIFGWWVPFTPNWTATPVFKYSTSLQNTLFYYITNDFICKRHSFEKQIFVWIYVKVWHLKVTSDSLWKHEIICSGEMQHANKLGNV